MANSNHPTSHTSHGIHTQSGTPPNLRNAKETMTEGFQNTMHTATDKISQVRSQAAGIADEATDMASEFYNNASTWLNSNTGRVVAGVAIVSAVGVFGYFIGRNANRSNY
jgi:hypothetical protein